MSVCRLSKWAVLLVIFLNMSAHSIANAAKGTTVVSVPGGRVTVVGAVINSGCLVSTSNTDKVVQMGEVRSNQFLGVGSDAQPVAFSIQLEDCVRNIRDSIGISFVGVANEHDAEVLAVSPGPNAAQGIGVALFDADNKFLPINTLPVNFTPLNKGVNTLHFFAKYRLAEQHPIPGIADAWANFTLTYQ
ncbi:fimbrial protein [Pseudomonas palleroniana]|uniref:fimbrial protein n=1 Tax=Pseudomonas palleroniana TaxID=191390 RepID=UPI003AFF7DC4